MQFSLEVGDKEKSKIEFTRDSFTGVMKTFVNGQEVAHQNLFSLSTHFSLQLKRRYEFSVGKIEVHKVIIEKERSLLFAGFLPHTYRVYIDGQIVHEEKG